MTGELPGMWEDSDLIGGQTDAYNSLIIEYRYREGSSGYAPVMIYVNGRFFGNIYCDGANSANEFALPLIGEANVNIIIITPESGQQLNMYVRPEQVLSTITILAGLIPPF